MVGVLHGTSRETADVYHHFDTHVTDNMGDPSFEPEYGRTAQYGRGSWVTPWPIAAMIMSVIPLQRTGCDFSGDLLLAFVPTRVHEQGITELDEAGDRRDMAVVGEIIGDGGGFRHRAAPTSISTSPVGWPTTAFPNKSPPNMAHDHCPGAQRILSTTSRNITPFWGIRSSTWGDPRHAIHTADKCRASFLRRDLPGETTEDILTGFRVSVDGLMGPGPQAQCAHASLSTIQQRIRLPLLMEPTTLVSGLSGELSQGRG